MPCCCNLCWACPYRAICSWLVGRHEHAQPLDISRAHLVLNNTTHGLLQPTSAYNFALAAGLKLPVLTARGSLLVTVRRKSASAGLFSLTTSPSIFVRFLQSKAPLLELQCTPTSAVNITVMLHWAVWATSKYYLGLQHRPDLPTVRCYIEWIFDSLKKMQRWSFTL